MNFEQMDANSPQRHDAPKQDKPTKNRTESLIHLSEFHDDLPS